MQVLDRVRETESLGREFLAWLWFRSETDHGIFSLGEDGEAEIWFDRKMTLQSEHDLGVETITCSGDHPNMREARFALFERKDITQAMVKLNIGDLQWSFVLDSTWLNLKTMKTPKVMQDKSEDPEGIFYEKTALMEMALKAMDTIFCEFIKLRVSPEWGTTERPALVKWINEIK
jgi:recombination associated protein RdgC